MSHSTSLSFTDAVRLFREWGFRVEAGPRPEEVTLILEEPDHRTSCVFPVSVLPEMASVALSVRASKAGSAAARQPAFTPKPQQVSMISMAAESALLLH